MIVQAVAWTAFVTFIGILIFKFRKRKFIRFKLPMITYPDCQACECDPETSSESDDVIPSSLLVSQLSSPLFYFDNLVAYQESINPLSPDDQNYSSINNSDATIKGQAIAGFTSDKKNPRRFKT